MMQHEGSTVLRQADGVHEQADADLGDQAGKSNHALPSVGDRAPDTPGKRAGADTCARADTPRHPPRLADLQRIVVLRALKLGDMLCAVPALRALRHAAPNAQITLIGLPWAQAFARRFACYVNHFIALPGFPGMPEQACNPCDLPPFLATVQAQRFELAIQLHGSGPGSNILTALLGAGACAGFAREDSGAAHTGMANAGTSATCLAWRDGEHEIRRWLRLMQALGAPALGTHLEFPVTAADTDLLARIAPGLAAPGTYAVVHPGASMASRRWPVARFAQVADALAARGLQIVLTGSACEAELTAAVRSQMQAPALDLAGATGLGALAALVRGAGLLVCNDTGVSHLAAAFGTPSVVVCCGADPARFAPLDRLRHRVLAAQVPCRPCMHETCPIGHGCALEISAEAVTQAAGSLLQHAWPAPESAWSLVTPLPSPEAQAQPIAHPVEGIGCRSERRHAPS